VTGQFPLDGFADFIGREDELAAISERLDQVRLVTILGTGGVGKTRIARRIAALATDGYPDGPWIVELSNLRDPALLPSTVASALGLPEQDVRSASELLLEYLRDRRLLLVLDTCEHLLDACAELIQAVMAGAPGVRVLATSRQPLDMSGEHAFPVGPMPVPESDSLTGTGVSDAVELFERRAAAAVPGFAITPQNAPDVIRLCRRLDGIPLAIELAAVRLRTMPLGELLERLTNRFAVLADDSPGALGRHQALRMAIEWSHELCSAAERRLWARLSVFSSPFSMHAAQEVCAEVSLEEDDVLQALFGLVDKSVVVRDGDTYRMLDTLREFGAEQLAASGEQASCRARHVALYLTMARDFGAHFASDGQLSRYRALHEAHPNLRTAMEYALGLAPGTNGSQLPAQPAAPMPPQSLRDGADLACSLYGYWQISGQLGEGAYWLTKVLDQFPCPSRERARALVNRGFLRSFQGDVAGALTDCEAGTALALAVGDGAVAARGYQHLMLSLTFDGKNDLALQVADEARPRLQACGDLAGELMLLAQLGHLHQLSGRFEECVTVCDEGLRLLGEDNDEQWIRTYLYAVSGFALYQIPGREADCETVLRKSLYGKQELGDVVGMAYALDVLGWLSDKTGSPKRAAWLLGAADVLWDRGGNVRFSGTPKMEELHQNAVRSAIQALGEVSYAEHYLAGADYMRSKTEAAVGQGALHLDIP
jgi:predicted ATPase